MFKMVVVSLAFLLFTAACTKQREAQFTTGQGENLLEVSAYDGKTFEITTLDSIEDQKRNYTKAQTMDVKAKQLGPDTFSVVKYEVNDPLAKKLLGGTIMVGKARTKYKGLIRVTQNFVKIYKVAKAEELPLNEVTYAEKLADGMLAVPLIGYPVTGKYTIDRSKNEVGEVSSIKYEKGQQDISQASHFRMDLSKGEIFEAVVKTDVMPTSYFEGEWYYNETVTSAPEENSTDLGFSTAYDTSLKPATRVKFLQDEKALNIVNVNVDQRLVQKENVNYKKVLTIPVKWKSYKVTSNGNGMAEKDDETVHWSKRPYVSMSLEDSAGAFQSTMDILRKDSASRLVALEVSDAYFSFVLENVESSTRIRYSFFKVKKSNYVAKRAYKEDLKSFGFFYTTKAEALTYENQRMEDREKNKLISRFNPQADIVFHFTKTSPEWIRPTVREAFKEWNDAFQKAGAKSRVILSEESDIELGDLRYNAVNIIENLTASNLFGFGPSVTDPFTGEIISATTNVHLTPIREYLISEIKSYIAMKLGQLEQGKLTGISAQLAMLQDQLIKQSGDTLTVMSDYFPAMKGMKFFVPDSKNPNQLALKNIDFRKRTTLNSREFDLAISSGNIHAEIEGQCPEIVDYIKEIQQQKVTHNSNENKALDSCSRKMVLAKFAGTLIHELGHNFGLRHNFMASNDSKNFWPLEVTGGKHKVRSSSVMEYSAFNEDRLVKPGPYDIAAIRFGYADSVELNNGSVKTLDTRYNLAQNLAGQAARSFKFCTDEDVSLALDPMCQRHDAGETPLEVVKNIIAEYQTSYQLRHFRRDAFYGRDPVALGASNVARFFYPLMSFYQHWRVGVARYVGQNDQYLERMNLLEYNDVIRKMSADPQFKDFAAQYKPVAQEIFKFFTSVAAMSNRYCVLGNFDATAVKVEEFNRMRENAYFTSKKIVNSCLDAQNQEIWSGTGFSLVQEIGHHLNTFRYDLSERAANEPYDVIGTEMDRFNAWFFLTNFRQPISDDSQVRGFMPSMMDEPGYREAIKAYATGRVQQGISGEALAGYIKGDDVRTQKIKAVLAKTVLPKFEQEKNLVGAMIPLWRNGIMIPGKTDVSLQRADAMSVLITRQVTNELLQSAQSFVQLGSGIYIIATSPTATDAIGMINSYKQMSALKKAVAIDENDSGVKKLVAAVEEILPASKLGAANMKDLRAHLETKLQLAKDTVSSETAKKYPMLVAEVANIYSIMNEVEEVANTGEGEAKENAKKLMTLSVDEFFKAASGGKIKPGGIDYVKYITERNNNASKHYLENRVDIDAQVDILTTTLMSLQ